jgi:hypothetical protein
MVNGCLGDKNTPKWAVICPADMRSGPPLAACLNTLCIIGADLCSIFLENEAQNSLLGP